MTPSVTTSSPAAMQQVFALQRAHAPVVARTSAKERIAKLKRLHEAVLRYQPKIREALYQDFRKPPAEVDLTEIYVVTSEIKHAIRHLKKWMRPRRVSTPMSLLGSRSSIHYEPKGVVLIISPWNFPFNLTFGPMVSAIAAGNCMVIKPSEHTPHTSALMQQIVEEVFQKEEATLLQGDHTLAEELLKLPFNHIFFTGSPRIGKIVMRAAAEHLASVTLELGGKSPVIVDETANLNEATTKLVWSKYANNGQTCIAPDYLYVHEKVRDAFLEKLKEKVASFYGHSAADRKASSSYARIVNHHHFHRVKGYIEEAQKEGGEIHVGGDFDEEEAYIAPTVITNVKTHWGLMQEEIFGPVLPVLSYSSLDEVIQFINEGEKPLALYIFSKNSKNINQVLSETSAGGSCVNDSAVHFYNNNLPFGGANNSGIGKSHGFFGFESFSNARAVLRQPTPYSALQMLVPPYDGFKQKMIDLTIRWF